MQRRYDLGLWVASCVVLLGLGSGVQAGIGRYDASTRKLHLSYCYADLPGFGRVAGTPHTIDPEQDRMVRSFIEEVSQVLAVATGGRLSIGSFTVVPTVAQADMVISPGGLSEIGVYAWASPGGLDQQGHIGVYYRSLLQKPRQGIVLTAAHEIAHYVFALPDEYAGTDRRTAGNRCPADARVGGCLMDNYWTRAWMHRFCGPADHNRGIVVPYAPAYKPGVSCQELVDRFFARHGLKPGIDGHAGGVGLPGGDLEKEEQARLQVGILSASRMVREIWERARVERRVISQEDLRAHALASLRLVLKELQVERTPEELNPAVERVLRQALVDDVFIPRRLVGIAPVLRQRAAILAGLESKSDPATRVLEILQILLPIAQRAVREEKSGASDAPAGGLQGGVLSMDELDYVDAVARAAVEAERRAGAGDVSGLRAAQSPVQLQYQQGELILEAVLDLASRNRVPGTSVLVDRREALGRVAQGFALPVYTNPRFGTRRTVIVAPSPLDPAWNLVALRSGVEEYRELRDRYLAQFSKLIQRTQTEFNRIDLRQRITGSLHEGMGIEPKTFTIGAASASGVFSDPDTATVSDLLHEILRQLREDQVENVIVLIPPGGLSEELGRPLAAVRDEILGLRGGVPKLDARLDLVTAGAVAIPEVLRDLCIRSGGSILTIVDTHDVGVLAQRLKNEQSAGAWIVSPRVFDIATGRGEPAAEAAALDSLRRVVEGARQDQQPTGEGPRRRLRAELDRLGVLIHGRLGPDGAVGEAGLYTLLPERAPEGSVERHIRRLARLLDEVHERVAQRIGELEPLVMSLQVRFEQAGERLGRSGARAGENLAGQMGILEDIKRCKEVLRENEQKERREAARLVRLASKLASRLDAETRLAVEEKLRALGQGSTDLGNELYRTVRMFEDAAMELATPLTWRFDVDRYEAAVRSLERGPAGQPAEAKGPSRRYWIYAENAAELEIIVSHSHLPPRADAMEEGGGQGRVEIDRTRRADELVWVQLLDAEGKSAESGPRLTFEEDLSTRTMRVYRLPAPKYTQAADAASPIGRWYQLEVTPNHELAGRLLEDRVRTTITVASLRPNVQLNVGLRSDEVRSDRLVGTYERSRGETPVVEVQVYGGAPILGARVEGRVQLLDHTERFNEYQRVVFRDDGKEGDRAVEDGVYSAAIMIPDRQVPAEGADVRILIQADATPLPGNAGGRNVLRNVQVERFGPAVELMKGTGISLPDVEDPQHAPALQFQRATTFRFHVK